MRDAPLDGEGSDLFIHAILVGLAQSDFVAGENQRRAFRWTAAGGMVDIGGYPGSPPFLAVAMAVFSVMP